MVYYEPKTGMNAGKKNFQAIKDYLAEHPAASGLEIASNLGLSKPTVYGHLKKLQKHEK